MTEPTMDAAPVSVQPVPEVVKDLADDNADILATALRLHDQGVCVIPVLRGKKKPAVEDWTGPRLTRDEVKQYFAKPSNIGVHWGASSDWRVDVDLDTNEAVRAAPFFLNRHIPMAAINGLIHTLSSAVWALRPKSISLKAACC